MDVRVEQLKSCTELSMEELQAPCYLPGSFGMVSQVHDIETRHRTLSPCHPSGKRIKGFIGIKIMKYTAFEYKQIRHIIIF